MTAKQFNIGLVLSGGGARGFAHLGLLQALNEAGIYPDVLSGTSAGAIVAVLYADGYTPNEILKLMNSFRRFDFIRPSLPKEGLLHIGKITNTLKKNLRAKTFEELKIPVYVSATDLNNGEIVYFSNGDLINPLIASASIPVLFQPVKINGNYYVDGGVLDNLPLHPVEGKCKFLIGSFVNPVNYVKKINGLVSIAERAFVLSMSKAIPQKSKKFDLFFAPSELRNYNILDTYKANALFSIGYKTAKEKLKEINIENFLA